MEQSFCQSCGMPMSDQFNSTNQDGSVNTTYCCHCYKDGKFTYDCTMDEMIQHCSQFVGEFNKNSEIKITTEDYISEMKKYFPTLLRWKK